MFFEDYFDVIESELIYKIIILEELFLRIIHFMLIFCCRGEVFFIILSYNLN